jgi:pantoate--beta-alanine ligase
VPTMGALHEGHLALVRQAAASADKVVVSIFVNPAQFGPQEDFGRYPRTLDSDSEKLERTGGVELIYAPKAGDIYPEGFSTKVNVEGPASGLETDFRPHFFSGVATVVAKLFVQCRPDIAVFGEKDYQQLLVVRRLSRDLDLGVDVLGVPTVREADGLALSSRNAYLTPESRKVAAQLNRVLLDVAERAGASVPVPQAEAEGAAALIRAGFDRVDYVAIRDAATLVPLREIKGPARVLAAARIGSLRLIDNRPV